MKNKLISFVLLLYLLIAIPLSARYKYNPFTRKLDYYETGADIDLGDLADVTLTGLATGNILYYSGTAWVNLATGANAEVLTLAGGVPTWAAGGAPAAHAASHEVGGADLVDHDQLTNYLAAQHLTLPNTIVAVLTDHNLLAHTALGLFDQSSDVDHNATTNYFIYNHVGEDHIVEHTLWIGWLAGQDLAVGGQFNTLVGEQAGTDITTGDNNTIVGYQAGFTRTTTSGSTFVGYQAGYQNKGELNTAIGYQAMYNDGAQSEDTIKNVAIGAGALYEIGGEAAFNVAVGVDAQRNLTGENEYNIAIGYEAGYAATGANYNVLVGGLAGKFNLIGTGNTVIGHQAGQGVATNSYSDNVFIGRRAGYKVTTGGFNVMVGYHAGLELTDGVRNTVIGYQAGEELSTGDDNIIIGYMAGEGWLDTENEKLVIDVTDTTTPLIYGDFSADNITINGDLSVMMDAALDQVLIQQSAVAGTEDQPLIFIDDDRTGVTAQEQSEATLYIDSEGIYAIYVLDGQVGFQSTYMYAASGMKADEALWSIGAGDDILIKWDLNGAGDDLWTFSTNTGAAGSTAALFYSEWTLNPTAMTDHDDYLSPSFVIVNWEAADANDYSAVVIGERTQASVLVAHYFDFYAMTGAVDGSVDPNAAELAAIFRFGASGTTVPSYATTPGDVLFEGAIEVANVLGYDYTTDHNLLYGYLAGEDLTAGEGQYNTLLGEGAGAQITTGDQNTIVGYQAGGNSMTIGMYQTLMGYRAGYNLPNDATASYNTFIGTEAGFTTTASGAMNVFIGYRAGRLNQGGYDNVFIGMIAGETNVVGYANVYVGNDSGKLNTQSYNTFVGGYAGWAATTGGQVLIGGAAGYSLTTGTGNTVVGRSGLWTDDDGGFNTAVGGNALYAQNSAWFNTAVGYLAGQMNVTGQNNVSIGHAAGMGVTANSNSSNVFIGSEAAEFVTTASRNVIIGHQAAEDLTTGGDNVIIGYMAGEGWMIAQTNQLIIANTDTATPLLHGDFTSGDLVSASLTHNSDHEVTGYRRSSTINWIDCFDHGSTVAKYAQDWEIGALNTQGTGTNDIDTMPSHITLTTDNNGVGDNEGTRLEETTILRSRQNRSEWSVALGQTVNTSFYMGWNTSGTNAMVAAANEYVIVFFDISDNPNWQIKVGDGATEDVYTSGRAVDTNFITHEIWVETDGTVHWAVNRTELDITGSVDNLMDAAAHYLIVGQAQSVTGAAVIVAQICHIENEKIKK